MDATRGSVGLGWRQGLGNSLRPRVARAPRAPPGSGADSEPVTKSTRQVRGVGEAGLAGCFADREPSLEQTTSRAQPQESPIAMGRHAERALEAARQVALRHLQLGGQIFE